MDAFYHHRPFNLRYVVCQRCERYTPELLRTHRTAKASWLYIRRQHGIDTFGPTPDWSKRTDLAGFGRCAPARANDPALDGIALWERADAHAAEIRPDEPVCAHVVGSLPLGGDVAGWRTIIEGFAEDFLVSQGMVVDWAVHYRDEEGNQPAILPHVHMLITMRAYDRSHPDVGRVRQNWLRTEKARKALAEKWWARTGLYPRSYATAA
jgi:hypothetical protein